MPAAQPFSGHGSPAGTRTPSSCRRILDSETLATTVSGVGRRGELPGGSPPRGCRHGAVCSDGPEGRERLPRLPPEKEIEDVIFGLRAVGETLGPDRISGSLFLARETERQSKRSRPARRAVRAGTVSCVSQMASVGSLVNARARRREVPAD